MSWTSESAMVSGLPQDATYDNPKPTVYDDAGTLKMIIGVFSGDFYGYYWDGSDWILDASIINGLSSVPGTSSPTIFNDSGVWKLISGSYGTDCYGYYWDGVSAWISDATIVTGLPTTGHPLSTPFVYNDSGTFKLILGDTFGRFTGYYWGTNTWVEDSSIVNGLVEVGGASIVCVYDDGGTWELIVGESTTETHGYYWDGSTWVKDNTINYGIVLTANQGWFSPTVFTIGADLKLIGGNDAEGTDDVFLGYTKSSIEPSFSSDSDLGVTRKAFWLNRIKER